MSVFLRPVNRAKPSQKGGQDYFLSDVPTAAVWALGDAYTIRTNLP